MRSCADSERWVLSREFEEGGKDLGLCLREKRIESKKKVKKGLMNNS